MNTISLVLVVITAVVLVFGWKAINKPEKPGSHRRGLKQPQGESARRR